MGPVTAERIKELLRAGEVSFVVADVGHAPRWISTKDAAVFWKAEVKNHLAEGDRFFLEDFPDGYALVASEWRRGEGCAVILLEAHH